MISKMITCEKRGKLQLKPKVMSHKVEIMCIEEYDVLLNYTLDSPYQLNKY